MRPEIEKCDSRRSGAAPAWARVAGHAPPVRHEHERGPFPPVRTKSGEAAATKHTNAGLGGAGYPLPLRAVDPCQISQPRAGDKGPACATGRSPLPASVALSPQVGHIRGGSKEPTESFRPWHRKPATPACCLDLLGSELYTAYQVPGTSHTPTPLYLYLFCCCLRQVLTM